jgi:Cytochrome c oxidase subunit IIa family
VSFLTQECDPPHLRGVAAWDTIPAFHRKIKMPEQATAPVRPEDPHEDFGHPRGTLAIVAVFGALFLLGWLTMYFYMFLQRGAPHS